MGRLACSTRSNPRRSRIESPVRTLAIAAPTNSFVESSSVFASTLEGAASFRHDAPQLVATDVSRHDLPVEPDQHVNSILQV